MPGSAGDLREPAGLRPSSEPVAPGERGATRIADRVLARIAGQAAREALGALPPDAAPPHATVVVAHGLARVRVVLDLAYPSDIAAQCAAVRRQVAERVAGLTATEVHEVAVHVERLHLDRTPGTAHGRTR